MAKLSITQAIEKLGAEGFSPAVARQILTRAQLSGETIDGRIKVVYVPAGFTVEPNTDYPGIQAG